MMSWMRMTRQVKNKAQCVIKMKAQRALKLIRLAESLLWMRLDPTSTTVLPPGEGSTKLTSSAGPKGLETIIQLETKGG
jgi:hypothetical protein